MHHLGGCFSGDGGRVMAQGTCEAPGEAPGGEGGGRAKERAPPPPHSQELALPHLPSVSTQRGWLRILGPRELEENTLRCRKSRMPWYLAAGHGHYGQLCFSGDSCRNQADVLIFRGGPDGETVNPVLLLFLSS